jgi:hypothetical protein
MQQKPDCSRARKKSSCRYSVRHRQQFLEVPPRTPPFLALKSKWGVQVGLGVPDSLTANDARFELGNTRIQSPTKAMARDLLERFAKGGQLPQQGGGKKKSKQAEDQECATPNG